MKKKKAAALLLTAAMAVSLLGGCGINQKAVVATMDKAEVSLGLANFMCRYQQALYDDTYVYYSYYYGYDFVWNEDMYGTGSTMLEDLRDNVMELLHEYYTCSLHAKDYGIALTDEETEEIADAAAEFMADNSEETLDKLGATQEIVEEFLTLYTIEYKVYEAVAEEAGIEISDEDANMRGYTYIRQYTVSYYDDDDNYTEYTEEEIAAFTALFEEMAEEIESGETLEDVAEEYEYETSYTTYAADDTSLDEDLKSVLDDLAEGETALVELDSYLYLVRLDAETDEDATEENRESLKEEAEQEYYANVLAGWQESDGWKVKKSVLRRIKFKNLFTTETESTQDEDNVISVTTTELEAVEEASELIIIGEEEEESASETEEAESLTEETAAEEEAAKEETSSDEEQEAGEDDSAGFSEENKDE